MEYVGEQIIQLKPIIAPLLIYKLHDSAVYRRQTANILSSAEAVTVEPIAWQNDCLDWTWPFMCMYVYVGSATNV